MSEQPRVGVAIIVTTNDRVLLIKRKGPHGTGTWSTPGGHLDFGETPEQCAAREAQEEVGIEVNDIHFRSVTNDLFESTGRHYITLWMEGTATGEPTVAAEREVSEIGWFTWDQLPEPLFLPLENFVKKNSYPPK